MIYGYQVSIQNRRHGLDPEEAVRRPGSGQIACNELEDWARLPLFGPSVSETVHA